MERIVKVMVCLTLVTMLFAATEKAKTQPMITLDPGLGLTDNPAAQQISPGHRAQSTAPQRQTWQVYAPMPMALYYNATVYTDVTGTPTAYSLGGYTGVAQNGIYAFDCNTETWSTPPVTLLHAVWRPAAATVGGKIYVFGGYDAGSTVTNYNQEYDPVAGTVTDKALMPTARQFLGAVAWNDTLIYVMGGQSTGYYSTVEIYDPANNTWTTGTPMPIPNRSFACGIQGDTIYTAGGYNASAYVAASYMGVINPANPTSITWTQIADIPTGPSATPGRSRVQGAGCNGKFYFTGGDDHGVAAYDTWHFDPADMLWHQDQDKPTPISNTQCAVHVPPLDGGTFLCTAGYNTASAAATNATEGLNDVGSGVTVIVWDFETGWQGWTHTNGQAFPAGWDVEASNIHPSQTPPDAGDSTMWIDSDASGGGYSDTALSPVLIPSANMDWLKYGICNYHFGGSTYINEVHVGLKYYTSGVWNAVELKLYPTSAPFGPAWDSVDVSSYATADFIQIYFYYTDLNTWGYWACFDNVSIKAAIAQHDVGVSAILEPVGTYFLNDVVNPQTVAANVGDYDETFDVILTMTHNASVVYADTASMALASGTVDTATFASYTFTDAGAYDVLSYTILIGDENPGNDTATAVANVYAGLIPYIIVDPDPTPLTGPYLSTTFQSWGLSGVYTTSPSVINADSLSLYQTAWFCTGIYSNYYPLTNEEATAIGTYLATGRSAYCEGGDAWGYVSSRTILCPLFGIDPNATTDGSADLYTVTGQANGQIPQVAGQNWSYTGENNYIDRLGPYASPPNGGTAEGFLWNAAVSYWTGVAYDQGTWKTVALSHELAGDVPGTMPTDSLSWWIAQYLNLPVEIAEQPVNNDVQAFGFAPRMSTLANDRVSISYSTTVQGHVSLQVYDGIGRLVQTLVNAEQPAGEKSLVWNRTDMNGRAVANGVYFLRLEAEGHSATHKMIFVR